MGGIKENWIVVVELLAKEYGKTLKDFIPSQISFLENANFNTDYCNELLNENKNKIINELKELEYSLIKK